MDSTLWMISLVWVLVILILFLIIGLVILALMLMKMIKQCCGETVQRRRDEDGGDEPGGLGGSGGPDEPGLDRQGRRRTASNLLALINVLEEKKTFTRAEFEEARKKIRMP
ncbi:hypothetical protein L0337_02455 [candidate division KSB1 bacterium]|nr:hypothetical protein [candidate division KSB1 bacterium]